MPAQVYAQKRDPKATEYFRKAMSKMIPGSSNYKITQSYLLHYLADTDQKEAFAEEALDYFDGQRTYNKLLRTVKKDITGFSNTLHLCTDN